MPPDILKLLFDMRSAAGGIATFVAGRTLNNRARIRAARTPRVLAPWVFLPHIPGCKHPGRSSAKAVQRSFAHSHLDDFKSDQMLKLAVEREFEIMGEAMGRLTRSDRATVENIFEYRRIIEDKLPVLIFELDTLIGNGRS